jgi:hypothetical protein
MSPRLLRAITCPRSPMPLVGRCRATKTAATTTATATNNIPLLRTCVTIAHFTSRTLRRNTRTRSIPLLRRQQRTAMDNSHQASTNYREAFQLFDKRGNGRVDRSALGDLLRACGQNPTLAEIGDLERGVGADCTFPRAPLSAAHLPHHANTHPHHKWIDRERCKC